MKSFKPGFRFSVLDAFVLASALCLAIFAFPYGSIYSVVIGYVVLHFFLFCNIIRISRIPELIWASVFLSLFYGHIQFSAPSFYGALIVSFSVTCVLIFLELRKPSYHGIFWFKVNPNLLEWFSENHSQKQ